MKKIRHGSKLNKLKIFLLMILSSVTYAREVAPIEFLETKAQVIAHYCKTNDPGPYGECGFNQNQKLIVLHFPKNIGDMILKHIETAKERRYYDELSRTDFFHGHTFLKGPQDHYDVGEYFNDLSAMLYHSAEYNSRWGEEGRQGVPVEMRRPRSYLGSLDGTVEVAIDIVGAQNVNRQYPNTGTIYSHEIVGARPHLTKHTVRDFGRYQKIFVRACQGDDCRLCEAASQFYILPEKGGRFKLADGQEVSLFLRCTYPRS